MLGRKSQREAYERNRALGMHGVGCVYTHATYIHHTREMTHDMQADKCVFIRPLAHVYIKSKHLYHPFMHA